MGRVALFRSLRGRDWPGRTQGRWSAPATFRRRSIGERVVRGEVKDVWELWTTKDGLESWWGPEGFSTRILKLNAVPGGEFEYELTVTDPVHRKGMEEAGLPLVSGAHGRFTGVILHRRLAYVMIVDFVSGVEPYETTAAAELFPRGTEPRLMFTAGPMHNEEWIRLAHLGWTSQLDRLAARSSVDLPGPSKVLGRTRDR